MRGERLVFALMLLWCGWAAGALAQTPQPDTQETPSTEETELPSMDFLEFLGEWETEDDGWVDPVELDSWTPPEEPQDEDEDKDANHES